MNKDDKTYYQIRMNLQGFDKDILSAVLFSEGCSGVEEFAEDTWLVYLDGTQDRQKLAALCTRVTALNPDMQPDQLLVTSHEAEDWNSEWKKHFQPLRIGEHIRVAPPWDLPELKKGDILIQIDPRMAFGTGSHETTKLMIRSMEKYCQGEISVLDAGTGSGILAILARKLGAKRVVGFDVEPEAIENAIHNARLNQIDNIDFRLGDEQVIPGEKFDLILANINRNTLIELIPVLKKYLKQNGILIISGILQTDEPAMTPVIRDGFERLERLTENEWSALVLKKIL
jgi:ribosomal protein L11 methyltransferase